MFVFALAVVFKICIIQFVEGDAYREMAEKHSIQNIDIPANRGNVYAADGSLLATSIPKYDIRIDAIQPKQSVFNALVKPLSDSLSQFSGKPSSYHLKKIKKARLDKNRYFLLARNISYSDYIRIRNFPMLNLGAIRGGLIVTQEEKRDHPMGGIAERTIGYDKIDEHGNVTRPGIDGYFGKTILRGTNGKRLMQKIGSRKWKPIVDYDQVEPQDGYDVYTTIDVNIQDIAHYSLLGQLEKYEADHGCAVVMDVKTGEIKAISNLGRSTKGTYYERLNYAVGESHEPGSTFKVMALMAALEDKLIDTSTVVDTKKGSKRFYGRSITDSRGHGKISAARALEVSSNIGLATLIDENYAEQPKLFINRLKSWNLHDTLGVSLIGEGKPIIPEPGDKIWSKNALPSMAYGYNMQMTPLQTLTFYNAIANGGEMVRPRFITAVKEFDRDIKTFDKEVINQKICSDKTLKEMRAILKNVVVRGTGQRMYSENFSMAGKTGTARADYNNYEEWRKDRKYVSSFAGYFPADNPKYSCIVVIHKPSTKIGIYGADVSGPVFKRIAQKIYTETPLVDEIESLEVVDITVDEDYDMFYNTSQRYKTVMPNVLGLPAMDALVLLENMGLKVKMEGTGTVISQSVDKGIKITENQIVVLKT